MQTTAYPGESLSEEPPYLVIDSFDQLRGPADGRVSLPNRILWNPSRPFDLSDNRRARSMLRIVLREARKQEDLETYVNQDRLVQLWGELGLPSYIAESWEPKFHQLAQGQGSPAREK